MIVGITGTNGAGKGTVVDYLVEQRGFAHYSVREFLIEEIERRGLPVDRSAMRDVANELRREHGPAYVVQTLFERAKAAGKDAVIESIRAVGEAEFLQSVGAKIVAVDADKPIRYDRAITRGSHTDKVTFEEFVLQEDREMAGTEPWDMNINGVMQMADIRIENNGSLEKLHQQIENLFAHGKFD